MATFARIGAIDYYLPEAVLSNDDLAQEFPEWSAVKILEKTGIAERHIAAPGQTATDLAVGAAEKLFAEGVDREGIDFVLLCTQSPDYFLPTSACLVQERLGLATNIGALDFNLGCSGFVYGLGLAKGLVETGQARRVLLLTSETYSKYMAKSDRSVRTLFGDAAAATLVEAAEADDEAIGPFVYGTDGKGATNLIVEAGASRKSEVQGAPISEREQHLYMNGPEIFSFTLTSVPSSVASLLGKANLTMEDVDLFVFHQANEYMLQHLRKKMGIPPEKFAVMLRDRGNTVSATIPIALADCRKRGTAKPGMRVMLVGFGVGYSWGATLVRL